MESKRYKALQFEIVEISEQDIIVTSGGDNDKSGPGDMSGW